MHVWVILQDILWCFCICMLLTWSWICKAGHWIANHKLLFIFAYCLILSCSHSKVLVPWWFRNNRNSFLPVLEVWSPRSRHRQIWCPLRTRFLVHRQHRLAVSSPGGSGEGAFRGFFYKDTDPVVRAPSSWPHHPPEAHLLTPSHWGWGSTCKFWGEGANVQSMVLIYSLKHRI